MEISHDLLYGKHINILMVERDLAVPIGSGSIEVPFYIATGGNHDDLLFAKSVQMNFFNHKGSQVSFFNDEGDELSVVISPSIVKSMTRTNLQKKTAQLKLESDQIILILEKGSSHSASSLELRKKLKGIVDLKKIV